MRTLLLSLTATLSGCALFASGAIEKTCEDLPLGCGGGVDSADTDDGGDDTGGGSDDGSGDDGTGDDGSGDDGTGDGDDSGPVDTGPPPEPLRGTVAVGWSNQAGLGVWVHDADGALLQELYTDDAANTTYALAWDPDAELLYAAFGGSLAEVNLKTGQASVELDLGLDVVALALVGDELWVIGADTLGVVDLAGSAQVYEEELPAGTLSDVSGGYYAPSRGAIDMVDLDADTPDLWSWSLGSEALEVSLQDFDSVSSRARLPFAGADERAWSCTAAGGVHRLEDLAAGDRTLERLIDRSLDDLVACGYDPGSDEVIMFSAQAGILRVSPDGTDAQLSLPSGYSLLSGAVW